MKNTLLILKVVSQIFTTVLKCKVDFAFELLNKCPLGKTMYTYNICCVCFHHSSYVNRAFKVNLPPTFITSVVKINKEQSPLIRKGINRSRVRVLLKNVNILMQLFNISAVKVGLCLTSYSWLFAHKRSRQVIFGFSINIINILALR